MKNCAVNRSITKNSDDYDKKYMKMKFNSNDDLPLIKRIEIFSMITVVRAVFLENSKYYFDDIMRVENINVHNILIDKKSYDIILSSYRWIK